jgi:ketosteroid isomerase-like protein
MTAMAHPNANLLRRVYEAAGTGDLQPLLDALADDVIWRDSSLGPLAGEYHGKDDVLAFFGKMMENYAGTLRVEVQDILANDDRGVVLTRECGETASESVSWTGTHIWTFRDGRCTEFLAMNDGVYNRFWARRGSGSAASPA